MLYIYVFVKLNLVYISKSRVMENFYFLKHTFL